MAAKTSIQSSYVEQRSVSAAIAAAAERISVVLKDKQLEALLAFMSGKDTFYVTTSLFFTGSAVLQSLFSIAIRTRARSCGSWQWPRVGSRLHSTYLSQSTPPESDGSSNRVWYLQLSRPSADRGWVWLRETNYSYCELSNV